VAILDAIKIVAAIMDNNYIRGGLISASRAVEKGLPFSLALKRDGTFPQMMVQLVAIGEETGTLDQSFLRVAKFYQDSAERRVKTLTTALEPFLLLLMGVMVGGLAIAVLLPMFNLVNVVK
jgi:type IV pilus assembly protein PilC